MLQPPGSSSIRRAPHPTRRKTEISPDDAIRQLQRLAPNKRCADCNSMLPSCVNLTVGSFVCITCAGIHRELNGRVKGVGHSSFTAEEVERMKATDNEQLNAVYLAKYNPSKERMKMPQDNSDQQLLKAWIHRKYQDKMWYSEPNQQGGGAPPPQQQQGRGGGYGQPTVAQIPPKAPADLFGGFSAPATAPAAAQSNQGWDAFGGSGHHSQQQQHQAPPPQHQAFNPTFPQQSTQHPPQQQQQQQPAFQANFASFDQTQQPPPQQQQQGFANFPPQQQQPARQQHQAQQHQAQQHQAQQHQAQQQPTQQQLSQQTFANFPQQPPAQQPSPPQQGHPQPPPQQQQQRFANFNYQHQPPPQQAPRPQQQHQAQPQGGPPQAQGHQGFANFSHQGFANFSQQQPQMQTQGPGMQPQQMQQQPPQQQQQQGQMGFPNAGMQMQQQPSPPVQDPSPVIQQSASNMGSVSERTHTSGQSKSAVTDAFANMNVANETTAPAPPEKPKPTQGASKYNAGQHVFYKSATYIGPAIVTSVHFDDALQPYYTIKVDGKEKQTDDGHLSEKSETQGEVETALSTLNEAQLKQVKNFIMQLLGSSPALSVRSQNPPTPAPGPTPVSHQNPPVQISMGAPSPQATPQPPHQLQQSAPIPTAPPQMQQQPQPQAHNASQHGQMHPGMMQPQQPQGHMDPGIMQQPQGQMHPGMMQQPQGQMSSGMAQKPNESPSGTPRSPGQTPQQSNIPQGVRNGVPAPPLVQQPQMSMQQQPQQPQMGMPQQQPQMGMPQHQPQMGMQQQPQMGMPQQQPQIGMPQHPSQMGMEQQQNGGGGFGGIPSPSGQAQTMSMPHNAVSAPPLAQPHQQQGMPPQQQEPPQSPKGNPFDFY